MNNAATKIGRPNSGKQKMIPSVSLNTKMLKSVVGGKTKESTKHIPTNKPKVVSASLMKDGVAKGFRAIDQKVLKLQFPSNKPISYNKISLENEHKKYSPQKGKIEQTKSMQKRNQPEQYIGKGYKIQKPDTAQSKKKLKVQNPHNDRLLAAKSYDDYQLTDQIKLKLNKLNPTNHLESKKEKQKNTFQPSPNIGYKIQAEKPIEKPTKINSIQKEQHKDQMGFQTTKGRSNMNQNLESKNVMYQKPNNFMQKRERESKQDQKGKNLSNKLKKEMQIRWEKAQKQIDATQRKELKIQLASECFERGETDLSRQYYQTILQQIDNTYHKTPEDEDTLAYICASLTNIHIFNKDPKYQQTAARALQIYDEKPKMYFQQKITLKNNIALASQNNKDPKTAITLYREVLELEDQFYSISDERRLSTLNNMFCLYCEQKMTSQAMQIYKEVEPIIKQMDASLPIVSLWSQNWKHYSPLLKRSS